MPDFITLRDSMPRDKDYPERAHKLDALNRVVDGTLYDHIAHAFGEEQNKANEYVPISQRRPSARTRLCRTVVNDSVSLLFSEGHFPAIDCQDEEARKALTAIIKETLLNQVMIDSATRGSVGSVAILMRVLKGRIFWDVKRTTYLTPTWSADAPDTLVKVTERYKVKGAVLAESGYTVAKDEMATDFWFQREWDKSAEHWYLPLKVSDAREGKQPVHDDARTVKHQLGIVPIEWVRNLPGGDEIDGEPTFPLEAVDTQIEADYLLSQGGRGLKYQADPTLLIKEPQFRDNSGPAVAGGQAGTVKGAANALVISTEGDAKLLEISGEAPRAVMDWVKGLRDIVLESSGGNRSNPDKLSAAQSGRAMELMNQALIWLADRLRISYGEGALLNMLRMVVLASQKYPLKNKRGKSLPNFADDLEFGLRWPKWYAPTYADSAVQATTLATLREGGLLSQETAVKSLAASFDIEDPVAEQKRIDESPPTPAQAQQAAALAAKPAKPSLKDAND